MFSLKINREADDITTVALVYKEGGVTLKSEPENVDHILSIDIPETGSFDTNPSNGTFCITWHTKKILMTVAKYGDGEGGSLTGKIKKTDAALDSLFLCLRCWKKAAEESKSS